MLLLSIRAQLTKALYDSDFRPHANQKLRAISDSVNFPTVVGTNTQPRPLLKSLYITEYHTLPSSRVAKQVLNFPYNFRMGITKTDKCVYLYAMNTSEVNSFAILSCPEIQHTYFLMQRTKYALHLFLFYLPCKIENGKILRRNGILFQKLF
jgi:hypothetical protein